MSNIFPGSNRACPCCGSSNVTFFEGKGILSGELTICRERTCKDCGAIFEPPAGVVLPVVAIGMGVLMLALGCSKCVSSISGLISGASYAGPIMDIVIYGSGVLGGIYVVRVGWAALRRKSTRVVKDTASQ
jgi:hypothetical protein